MSESIQEAEIQIAATFFFKLIKKGMNENCMCVN